MFKDSIYYIKVPGTASFSFQMTQLNKTQKFFQPHIQKKGLKQILLTHSRLFFRMEVSVWARQDNLVKQVQRHSKCQNSHSHSHKMTWKASQTDTSICSIIKEVIISFSITLFDNYFCYFFFRMS
jgi:hypothetical protein